MTTVHTPQVITLDGTTDNDRNLLGGKAWSIQRMLTLGIPVPPAFVLTTDVCRRYFADGAELAADVWYDVPAALATLEAATDRRFGSATSPLLVSVRSGAATSMPGMMDTILNLGFTDDVERALAEQSGAPEYAADTRRRFAEQFEKVVGIPPPAEPFDQLHAAVVAVFESWNSKRAIDYRAARGIPDDGGTAVTVQAMVFGNLRTNSGTGVLFSRNPLTGSAEAYGEWLPGGQGEDVVSGRADALPLATLAGQLPEVHAELMAATSRLEADSRDVQDIEFTVENGTLWLLQSRVAKRSPQAAVRHAVLMWEAGYITTTEALDRISPEQLSALLTPHVVPAGSPVAAGKPACPGIATGVVVIDPDEALDRADAGESVVLARPTTDPDDVSAMSVAVAVVTEFGGSTSHAAVVCREMAVPCIVGCGTDAVISLAGQTVTVDAGTGNIYAGVVPVNAPTPTDDPALVLLTEWARAAAGSDRPLVDLLSARKEAVR